LKTMGAKGGSVKSTVLVVTNEQDESVPAVTNELDRIGVRYHRLDTERFPYEVALDLHLSGSKAFGAFRWLSLPRTLRIGDICSVWYRRPLHAWVTKLHPGHAQFIQDEARAALWSVYTTIDAFWMNPPLQAVHLLQHNKLHQLRTAAQLGLSVPDTVITNDPEVLTDFADAHEKMIAVKLLRGNCFVREGGSPAPLHVFTNTLSREDIDGHREDIKLCPVFAQEYIPKQLELRITIVGNQVFTCAIHSQDSEATRLDWRRYDFDRVKHESYALPSDIAEKLRLLIRGWGLAYGAIDMIVTPKGEYVFLEINPSGQWLWIEQATGMPISRAIAETLAVPSTTT